MQSFAGSGNRILVLLMMNATLVGMFLVLMPTMPIMAPLSLPLMMKSVSMAKSRLRSASQ